MTKQKQPDYITHQDENSITIDVSKWQGKQETAITLQDLVEYFAYEANDDSKQLKNLAGIYGDWQNINKLAEEVLEYFKQNNREELNRKAQEYGIFFSE